MKANNLKISTHWHQVKGKPPSAWSRLVNKLLCNRKEEAVPSQPPAKDANEGGRDEDCP